MAQKKKSPKQEVDESTLKLLNLYRKKCEANGVQQVKIVRDRLEAAAQDGKLDNLQLLEELGPIGVRALMEAFMDISYKHLKKLKLWKVKAQDEGLRSICNYIDKSNTIQQLDLLDNQITPLGCQFLGKTLANPNCSLVKLKLAHNNFGSQGLKNMGIGLATNKSLQKLNIKYCQIDAQGIRYIQQMLANINTKLISLKLQGNPLRNDGLYELLRALEFNQTLQKINISDIQINMLQTVNKTQLQKQTQQKLLQVIEKNKHIFKWDLKYNLFTDNLASAILASVGINDTILKLELPDTVSIQVRQLLANAVKKRKPKKKGKKGKSKKK